MKGALKWWAVQDLVTSRLVDPRRSRPRLAMLAFRAFGTQTRIRLRLSNPTQHQAVGVALVAIFNKNTRFRRVLLLNMGSTGFEPVTFRV